MTLRRTRRLRLAASLALLLVLASAPEARANGDPASDYLLLNDVFYPFTARVSPQLARQLDSLTAATKRAGYPLKVALIASPQDLGSLPDLWRRPQRYAEVLEGEISFHVRPPLLVVMPAGFGLVLAGPRAKSALTPISIPRHPGVDGLARAAILAVPRLASAAGHPVKAVVPVRRPKAAGSAASVLLLAVPLVLLLGVLTFVSLRARRRDERPGA